MKYATRTSRRKGDASKKRAHDVALAPSHAPEESSSLGRRSERTKKNQTTEARSYLQSVRKARRKTQKEECGGQNDEESGSENEDETKPGAYGIDGPPQAENHPIEENEQIDVSSLEDGDIKARKILVEADLAPELTSAEEVNIQEEEEMIFKKRQYKRVLWFAMVFYGLAIIGNMVAFVLLFVNPPQAFGRFFSPLWNGLLEAACFLLIAVFIIFIPIMGRCCSRSSIRLEQYAPDDVQLLRETQIVSVASFCLFPLAAIPIIVICPNLQWLGYGLMTWSFAGTAFAFSQVHFLRRPKETRQKKPKLFWVLFVGFFIGLTGITIWRFLNPKYPHCNVDIASLIGDGFCNGDPFATEACGYDGGDCASFFKEYPGCHVEYPYLISNGQCDGGAYNTKECGYDGGDCAPLCVVPNPYWIGDGHCDGIVYGTVECGFDGGDCLGPGERCRANIQCASEVCNSITKVCDSALVSELYTNCSVGMPDWIGDGECDGGYYASEACGYDGGDCLKLDEPCVLDEECASGLCNTDTKGCYLGILEGYPDCIVEYPRRIGDGKCDVGVYASYDCGYDGGDCLVNPAY